MDFTSRQLRAFLLVAQHRSFSRAAEALFITPSGLSVLIRELEVQLGFRLFERTTRHVAPTPHGAELIAVVQRNLAELDAATSRIGQSASEAGQSLTLGAPPLIAANIIVQAIKEFRTHRPGLRIQLHDENVATILPLVQAGKLDIGLGPFESATGVRRTPLFRSPLVVVRPDNDPAFRRATTTWSALRNEKLITLRPTGQIQQLMSKHLSRAGIKSGANTSVNLLDTQIAMVEAGDGIAVIPSFFMSACRNRRVSTSRLVNPVVTIGLYLISNRAKKLPQGADEFTEFLKSFVGRWIDHVEGGLR
ncbi:MAG: LysR family transcriptional regulator [Acidobacteriia bacterium]|nr:LysR family transcriptional regulator [Terriglobia bacterium]